MDGGRVAARGFLYQYQRTLEVLLDYLEEGKTATCRVEGDLSEPITVDAVDFDVVGNDGQVLLVAQVKSSSARTALNPAYVMRIFDRLTAGQDAAAYQILTNASINQSVNELLQVLHSNNPPDMKRKQLQSLLKSENVRRAVEEISDSRLAKLTRCEILVDDRSQSELRAALISKVRRARISLGLESGVRCGGLLLAYLLSEVHQRASFSERSVWSVSELAENLSLDESALVSLLGSRDRGVVFGLMAPVPDISREDLLEKIVEVLPPTHNAGNVPRVCQLTGLSGIGKSSMAAAFIGRFADTYSAIYWVDASTDDSLIDGFQVIAKSLGVEADNVKQMRISIHERLSATEGNWLLVLDDAQLRSIEPYLPRFGCGDVIVTSTDSVSRLRSATSIELPVMQPTQAADMVAARFGSACDLESTDGALVRQLAVELGYWPLAIELASGYMVSCGYDIRAVPKYLQSLKMRSLDDLASVPIGYPRTLVAAIFLVLDLVEAAEDAVVAEVASEIVKLCAYLAGRRIPLHLVMAARDPSVEELPAGSGPLIVEDPRVMEVLRLLRQVSLVRRDVDLSGVDDTFATANVTFSANSVLQEVVRSRLELDPQFWNRTGELDQLAYHLVVWISSAGHNGEADRARSLLPHCTTLVDHFFRLELGSQNSAVLMGNVANMYSAMHRRDEAVTLLEAELGLLSYIAELDDFLPSQVKLNLATALAHHEYPTEEQCVEAVAYLESILQYCIGLALDDDTHKQSATFCVRSLNVLDSIEAAGHSNLRSRQLASVFGEIMSRLPRTYEVDVHDGVKRASVMLSAGEYANAEQTCLPLIAENQYGTSSQLEVRRILLEAYVGQEKWPEANEQLSVFIREAGADPVYRSTVQFALHNVGLVLSLRALIEGGPPRALFRKVMDAPCFRSIVESAVDEYRVKFDIFSLASAILAGDRTETRRLSLEVKKLKVTSSDLDENAAWSAVMRFVLKAAEVGSPR